MLGATANLPKTSGHALLVGTESCCDQPRKTLTAIGYHTDSAADPYSAMLELCRRPLVYRAMVLSLQSIYRDELSVIATIRRRFPHVSIWLSHTDGRVATLAEAMRLGAEALLSEDGVHPFNDALDTPPPPRPLMFRPVPTAPIDEAPEPGVEPSGLNGHNGNHAIPTPGAELNGSANGHAAADKQIVKPAAPAPSLMNANRPPTEPVLSAAELRALLGESTS